jgi:hypothetical protein
MQTISIRRFGNIVLLAKRPKSNQEGKLTFLPPRKIVESFLSSSNLCKIWKLRKL